MSPRTAPSSSASRDRRAPFRSGSSTAAFIFGRGGRAPFGQALHQFARRHHLAGAAPVDHLAFQAPADRPPEVLLDLAARERLWQLALVVVDSRLRDAGADQGGEIKRLVAARLRIADPELDGAEPMMWPNAPPELSRLDDRAGGVKSFDESGVGVPIAERLMDSTTRKGPREDLRADRVEAPCHARPGKASLPTARGAAAPTHAGGRRRRSRDPRP